MEDIKKIKFDVAQSEYQLKRRELIIKDLECKTREVQLLKVKKESREQALESAVMCDFSSLHHVEDLMCTLKDHATQASSPDLAGHLADARDLSYSLAYKALQGDVTELTLKSACGLWTHTASTPQLMQISG